MSKVKFGGTQPNPKESKVWLHPHDGLKTYNQKKQVWTGGSSNDAPTDESESLYEFVDLGLPSGTLWATCNVGATKPEESGLYFSWGETEGYERPTEDKGFYIEDYKFYINGSENYSKYSEIDGLTELEKVDDAAYQSNNNCRMPNYNECIELIENTEYKWQEQNGVIGAKITSKINGNSIFIPGAGCCYEGIVEPGSALTWSSTIGLSFEYCRDLAIGEDFFHVFNECYRSDGLPIRPVQDK